MKLEVTIEATRTNNLEKILIQVLEHNVRAFNRSTRDLTEFGVHQYYDIVILIIQSLELEKCFVIGKGSSHLSIHRTDKHGLPMPDRFAIIKEVPEE